MTGLGALGGLYFSGRPTFASSVYHKDRFFIFCNFGGGWDLLLGLDPRDPTIYPASAIAQTQIQLDYDRIDGQLAHTDGSPNPNGASLNSLGLITTDSNGNPFSNQKMRFGPAIGNMRNHTDCIAVVNGMSMNTLSHTVGQRYILTGRPPEGLNANGSSMATWLAYLLGQENPIPNLVFNLETYNRDVDVWASGMRVSSIADLVQSLRPGEFQLSATEMEQIDHLMLEFASRDVSERSYNLRAANTNRMAANNLIDYRYDELMNLSANTPEMMAFRDYFGVNPNDLGSPQAQAASACLAITNKVSRTVSVQASGDLDTHGQNWADFQAINQQAGWNVVARMIDYLKSVEYEDTGETWMEHVTILCTSDFSRTPLINPSGGRDHHLLGSCLMAGAGIVPGVYGESTNVGHRPFTTNLLTGETDENGEVILPQHIARTLFKIAGVEDDISRLRVDPITAMLST